MEDTLAELLAIQRMNDDIAAELAAMLKRHGVHPAPDDRVALYFSADELCARLQAKGESHDDMWSLTALLHNARRPHGLQLRHRSAADGRPAVMELRMVEA